MSAQQPGLVRQIRGVIDAAASGASTLSFTVVVLWIVHGVNMALGMALNPSYGIIPRSFDSLWKIVLAPFLHGTETHLLFNTMWLVLLGAMTMMRRRSDFVWVSLITGLTAGLGAWTFGAPGYHVGASGVIFGYLGFLMARGVFERSLSAILLSAAVTWFFGSMVTGILPTAGPISWQSHLFGFLGGIGSAAALTPRRPALRGTEAKGRARL